MVVIRKRQREYDKLLSQEDSGDDDGESAPAPAPKRKSLVSGSSSSSRGKTGTRKPLVSRGKGSVYDPDTSVLDNDVDTSTTTITTTTTTTTTTTGGEHAPTQGDSDDPQTRDAAEDKGFNAKVVPTDIVDIQGPRLSETSEVTPARRRTRQLIRDALLGTNEQTGPLVEGLSITIENYMVDVYNGPQEEGYRDKLRSILSNLRDKDNTALKYQIRQGQVTPAQLVASQGIAFASQQKRERHEEALKAGFLAAQVDEVQEFDTNEYACPKCGGRNCRKVTIGARRDLGKCETWGNKDDPSARIRVTCQDCHESWLIELA